MPLDRAQDVETGLSMQAEMPDVGCSGGNFVIVLALIVAPKSRSFALNKKSSVQILRCFSRKRVRINHQLRVSDCRVSHFVACH